jgi:uncharacterized protein YjbI with pentapeptide repeats
VRRAEVVHGWRERWRSVDSAAVRSIAADLISGRPVTATVFDTVAGRVDLRGLPLTEVVTDRRAGPRRARVGDPNPDHEASPESGPCWTGLDLSGADLTELGWTGLTVRDCILDDANLEGLRCWGVTVTDTSMRTAKLFHGQLGAPAEFWPHRSRWQRVDFTRADLRGATADAIFEAVKFDHAPVRYY